MSTNISKQKREDLLNKIKAIRAFTSAAPQNENTGNLLSYLSDLEKDVNGKKYGLVFEEHCEEIDEVLDTHTPVLIEEKDLRYLLYQPKKHIFRLCVNIGKVTVQLTACEQIGIEYFAVLFEIAQVPLSPDIGYAF